jgi:glycine cleavage system H protein
MVKIFFEGKELEYPDSLLYLATHQWINLEDGKVGITSWAADQLGDINFCDAEGIEGKVVSQVKMSGNKPVTEPLDVVVESSKAMGDVYCPLSGKVIAINRYVMGVPKKINEDPYGDGWLFQLEPSNPDQEKDNLISAKEYAEFIST